jgi:hypothetical protein
MTETAIPRTTLIKNFLSLNSSKPVSNSEFMEFWKACSEDERNQFAQEVYALTVKQ